MAAEYGERYMLDGVGFRFVKAGRRLAGIVLRSEMGDLFARLGPREIIEPQQAHAENLDRRGFPVPEVVYSGEHETGDWYFVERSVGEETFHARFAEDWKRYGSVQADTFRPYLAVMQHYARAQMAPSNRTDGNVSDFVQALIPQAATAEAYAYHGHDASRYLQAMRLTATRLSKASMGLLQYDLNPFNVLEDGIIDFELAGAGPLGYDLLLSARWGGTWYTNYPSRYPAAYRLSSEQLALSDAMVDEVARSYDLAPPTKYLEEFLLLRSAYALAYFDAYDPRPYEEWPVDRRHFRQFRANVLHVAVESYLGDRPIPYWEFPDIPGGELPASWPAAE